MRLTVIGCSGSFPGPDSAASCYLLTAPDATGEDFHLVLDLGNGSIGRLQSVIDLDRVGAVALSHLHPDHCMDMCGYYVFRKYHPRVMAGGEPIGRIPVHAPAGAKERLQRAYRTEPVAEGHEDLECAFDFHDLGEGSSRQVGPFTLESHLVEHPVEAYALRVTGPAGEVLTYSGDTDLCEGLVRAAAGADLLLCEAAFQADRDTVRGIHLTGERAGQAAQRAGARDLRLTHIPAWTDRAIVTAEARAAFDGPVTAVVAGESIDIRPADAVAALTLREGRE